MIRLGGAPIASDTRSLTNQQVFRTFVTWTLLIYGSLLLLLSAIATGLLIIVPVFELENGSWRRVDNPITMLNIAKNTALGAGCLYLSKASDRTRIWAAVVVILTTLIYGFLTL